MIKNEIKEVVDEIQTQKEQEGYQVVRYPHKKHTHALAFGLFHLLLFGDGEVIGIRMLSDVTPDSIHRLRYFKLDIPNFKKVICYKRGDRWIETIIG